MNDAEKVREALDFGSSLGSHNYDDPKAPVYIWTDAETALDSILTELAETKERIRMLEVHLKGTVKWRNEAEERAEKAETAIKAVEEHIATVKGWTMDMHGQTLRAALYIAEALGEEAKKSDGAVGNVKR